MRDFRPGNNRGGFRGGGRPGGNRFGGGFGGRDGGSRGGSFRGGSDRRSFDMHEVTCDKCGKNCKVPFKPTGDKPVYCSDCFRQNEGSSPSRNNFNSRGSSMQAQSGGASSQQMEQINAKLDKILLVLQDLEIDTGDDEDSVLADDDSEDDEGDDSEEDDSK